MGEDFLLAEKSVVALQEMMGDGRCSSLSLVEQYLDQIEQIDRAGPTLNSVLEINPEVREIAQTLDEERAAGNVRGPLHGIPVLLKDNIDTGDKMLTTAGSLALASEPAPADAFLVQKLREAGAVILGKTNLSEWANFRSTRSSSGWSSRGGQTLNPYGLDRSPSGSSSGSGSAVAASLCAVAVGTETDGSITSPAAACGVVGIKPTVGLVSRRGIVPIAVTQDTAGPMSRTVADSAALLSAMAGFDAADEATHHIPHAEKIDYTQYLDKEAFKGAKIGVVRSFFGRHPESDRQMEEALSLMSRLGAEIVDHLELPAESEWESAEIEVLLYEFKDGLNRYLATRGEGFPLKTLSDLITFNRRHAAQMMPIFGQETLTMAQQKGDLEEADYLAAWQACRQGSRAEGLDLVLAGVDALVGPTRAPAWLIDHVNGDMTLPGCAGYPAVAGYPHITLPLGYTHGGLPLNISFMGRPWEEGRLIGLAYAFEQARPVRRPPHFPAVTSIL